MTKQRRILFVNSPVDPGADTWIQAMIMRSLDRAAFQVHAACSMGPDGAPGASFELLRAIPDLQLVPANFGPSLFGRTTLQKAAAALGVFPMMSGFASLVRYIRRHQIEILHSSDRARDALACVLLAKATGAKSVVHVHVGYGDWMSPFARWSMARADALIGVSGFVVRSLVQHGGYRAARTHAVLNAIDAAGWDPALDGGPIRSEFGVPHQAPLLVSVSRLFHWKGQGDVVRALKLVHLEFPEARLLIVGKDDRAGSPDRPSFSAELRALSSELGLDKHVTLTGFRSDINRFMAAADVFAMPSQGEPFGLVFLEAMAMKKPVVALDNGGTPEVVEQGKSGLLSSKGDIAGLAANIALLLRDPALRRRMGESGRARVEARFTPQRMASDTAQVYASLFPG